MKEVIDLIVDFNQIKINGFLFEVNSNEDNIDLNDIRIADQIQSNKWPQIRVTSDLCQTICFTKKLNSCVDYRRNVFNNLKRKMWKKYRNMDSNLIEAKTGSTGEPNDQKLDIIGVRVSLQSMQLSLAVDKIWNHRILSLVVIRLHVEDSLSWLSTLGGAYSSLGEYNVKCAVKAGQISVSQLHLASITGDPNIIAKCGIYMAYSLCQQNRRRDAIKMIRRTLFPYISNIEFCDKIVKTMYSSLSYRIKNF